MSPEVAQAFGATNWAQVFQNVAALTIGTGLITAVTIKPLRELLSPKPKWDSPKKIFPYIEITADGKFLRSQDDRYTAVFLVPGAGVSYGDDNTKRAASATVRGWLNSLAGEPVAIDQYTFREPDKPQPAKKTFVAVADQIIAKLRASHSNQFQSRHFITITSRKPGAQGLQDVTRLAAGCVQRLNALKVRQLDQSSGDLVYWISGITSPISRPRVPGTGNNLAATVFSDRVSINFAKQRIEYSQGKQTYLGRLYTFASLQGNPDTDFIQRILSLPHPLVLHNRVIVESQAQALGHIGMTSVFSKLQIFNDNMSDRLAAARGRVNPNSDDHAALTDYGFSVMVFGRSEDELEAIDNKMEAIGGSFVVTRETDLFFRTYLSLFPVHQVSRDSQKRFTDFVETMMNFPQSPRGPQRTRWLDRPIDYFPTADGSLYNFSFHISTRSERDNNPPAHGAIIGGTGGGKTTLMERLAIMARQNISLQVIWFDADDGCYIMAAALGAPYIKPGDAGAMQINPCQGDDTPENRQMLRTILQTLAGRDDADTLDQIEFAINLIYLPSMTMEARNLRHIVPLAFPMGESGNARDNIMRFLEGDFGPAITAELDSFINSESPFQFIDFSTFAKNPTMAAVFSTYALTNILNQIDRNNKQVLLVWDEAASAFRIPAFAPFAQIAYERFRKKASAIWSLFQNPQQIVDSGIGSTILQLAPNKVFIPNADASEQDYAMFELRPEVYKVIKDPRNAPASRLMTYPIVLQRPDHTVVLEASLAPIGSYLRLFEGGEAARSFRVLQSSNPETAVNDYMELP